MSLTFALQSLLARHESYVLEAEDERQKMAASIDRLECDKKELEAANARTIEDNRSLLDQLEGLNNAVSDSESHILSLNATLLSTRQELDRLNALAARTSHLEAQLSLMETEQISLHEKLLSSEEGQRSAIQRWKDAERTVILLQEQTDRIEAEARDESERHAEVMNHYERRQAVERQLESAAGRLKGAAAATTLGNCSDGNNNVVSHFVKDLLADNASLQMGIMELREMLTGSNDEVQNLREQMMLHQEVPLDQHQDNPRVTLDKDLGRNVVPEAENIPALHVHHHYHEATKLDSPVRQRSTGPRRVRRRRNLLASGVSTPRLGLETPTPRSPSTHGMRLQQPSSAATILSQTAASIPPSPRDLPPQASAQPTHTYPSIAPSLESNSPYPSMFDFLSESSRPTSPDSTDVFSPPLLPVRSKKDIPDPTNSSPPSTSSRNLSHTQGLHIQDNHFDYIGRITHGINEDHGTIFEEPEIDLHLSHLPGNPTTTKESNIYSPVYAIRKSASHESILSTTTGILPQRTLRQQHSQLLRGAGLKSRASFGPSLPVTTMVSSKPVISANSVTASSSSLAHANSAGKTRAASSGAMSTLTSSLLGQNNSATAENDRSTLGKRVGGWVWGKWGVAPVAEREERLPGVNQKGSLRGVKGERRKGKAKVEVGDFDEGLLRESLGEG
ncbi:MAG: hypothetical protein Q9170_005908 [Blastenia crenularia]